MIRLILWLLVFVIGLGAAVVWKGQMHHLRLAVPERLPSWTEALPDDAGILRGTAALPDRGLLRDATLTWTARAPSAAGWLWDIRLRGDGIDLAGRATLAYWPDRAQIEAETGSVDLGKFLGDIAEIQGLVSLGALTGTAEGLLGSRRYEGELSATANALVAEDVALGSGMVTGDLSQDGAFQATAALSGGATPIDAALSGDLTNPIATLDLTVQDAAALPSGLRRALEAVGQAQGEGLQARLPVPFR